jgi:hypothetical protein
MKSNQVKITVFKMIKENQRIKIKETFIKKIQKIIKVRNNTKKSKNLICHKIKIRNRFQKWKMIKLIQIQKMKLKTIKVHNRTILNCLENEV